MEGVGRSRVCVVPSQSVLFSVCSAGLFLFLAACLGAVFCVALCRDVSSCEESQRKGINRDRTQKVFSALAVCVLTGTVLFGVRATVRKVVVPTRSSVDFVF